MMIRAKFVKGIFKPIDPVPELNEGASVVLTVRKPLNLAAIRKFRGILTAEEGEEIRRLIREERRVEGSW
jgi:predicted DNA-binding antitoxin AbrB/MazE fold protein